MRVGQHPGIDSFSSLFGHAIDRFLVEIDQLSP